MAEDKRPLMVGIHNSGKDNVFINIETEGFDVGVVDEGERTKWVNTRHIGRATSIEQRWYEHWLGKSAIGLAVAIIAGVAVYWLTKVLPL